MDKQHHTPRTLTSPSPPHHCTSLTPPIEPAAVQECTRDLEQPLLKHRPGLSSQALLALSIMSALPEKYRFAEDYGTFIILLSLQTSLPTFVVH